MKPQYPHLCSPIRIGKVTFRNRMFSAPMGATEITADHCVTYRTQGFYELRAKGGAAAVTMSEMCVHPPTDGTHMIHGNPSVSGSLGNLAFAADGIRRHGAIPSIELSHAGQIARPHLPAAGDPIPLYGPVDCVLENGSPVKGLTKEQIRDIVEGYGKTAAFAKRAGFEMVMVHGGHGWLLNQFISPRFNHRTDEYGGSFENRMRFTIEALQCVRAAVGPDFLIEFRMSGDEFIEGGYHLDEGVRIAQAVEPYVDIIHVSAGHHELSFYNMFPSMFYEHGVNVRLAAEIKKHVSKPVATLGALSDPQQMEEIIASGKADIIYMARQLLADPQFPNKVMSGRGDETIRCIRCLYCMAERRVTQTRRCSLEPRIGREFEEMDEALAARPKKVLVVGGGIAGMKAALTAAQRGHSVVLCEKSGELGGLLKCEQGIPFKREMYDLVGSFEKLMLREGVEIRKNTEVDAAYAEKEQADAVIIAVGSHPIIPPIPGIHGDKVILVNDFHLHEEEVGQRVVVLGGGLSGCECAIHLAHCGKQVTIVEMADMVAQDANRLQRPALLMEMEKYGIDVRTQFKGVAVSDEGLVCDNKGREVLVPCDTIICAAGQRPDYEGVEALRYTAPFVREIGDCVKVANVMFATYMGYHAALDV